MQYLAPTQELLRPALSKVHASKLDSLYITSNSSDNLICKTNITCLINKGMKRVVSLNSQVSPCADQEVDELNFHNNPITCSKILAVQAYKLASKFKHI